MSVTKKQAAISEAGKKLAVSDQAIAQMTPREQAEAAWTPTSRYASVDELEDAIRAQRGLPPVHSAKTSPAPAAIARVGVDRAAPVSA